MLSALVLICFGRPRLGHTIKTNFITFQTVDPEIFSILILILKGLGLAPPSCFVYDFLRQILLMLYSINWPNFILWLSLRLEILGNMCIVIICCPVCDVIHFRNSNSFLIKLFFYITKKSWKERKKTLTWNKKYFLLF